MSFRKTLRPPSTANEQTGGTGCFPVVQPRQDQAQRCKSKSFHDGIAGAKCAKASRGFEPRSLDSESRVLTVTPRGQLFMLSPPSTHTHTAGTQTAAPEWRCKANGNNMTYSVLAPPFRQDIFNMASRNASAELLD